MSVSLAIIGSAGRGSDGDKLRANPAYWRMMGIIAQSVTCVIQPTRLVSGGSAYADHLAVQLYLSRAVKDLSLHLPCDFLLSHPGGWMFDPGTKEGERLNQLHTGSRVAIGRDPFADIACAFERGATIQVNRGGFKARNSDVANEADVLLAFTFGVAGQPQVADGGTADTVRKFLSWREAGRKRENGETGFPAYHFNLTDRVLYRL